MKPINQILATGINIKNGDIKKIIRFFCIVIVIFGIIFISEGSYGLVKNSEESKKIAEEKGNAPVVSITEYNGTHARIYVTDDRGVQGILYHWNSEANIQVNAEGKTIIEELVELKVGNNKLNVLVEDIDGNQVIESKDFILIEEPGVDIIKPTIELNNTQTILTIIAKDNDELKHMTYKWEGQDEIKIDAEGLDKTKIETEVSIPLGENTITIYAIDAAGNEYTEEKTYRTIVKPTIGSVQEGGILKITAKDAKALSHIIITINGIENRVDAEAGATIMTYEQTLNVGENNVQIIVYNSDNQTKTHESRYLYSPE